MSPIYNLISNFQYIAALKRGIQIDIDFHIYLGFSEILKTRSGIDIFEKHPCITFYSLFYHCAILSFFPMCFYTGMCCYCLVTTFCCISHLFVPCFLELNMPFFFHLYLLWFFASFFLDKRHQMSIFNLINPWLVPAQIAICLGHQR
jgi:hypothetical protein